MKRSTSSLQPLIILLTLLIATFPCHAQNFGFGTNGPPTYQFQMVNVGAVGATTMSEFTNNDTDGVSLSGYTTDSGNAFNAIEGATDYLGTGFIVSGIFGLGLNSSAATNATTIGARGHSNEWQGDGVRGSRFNSGGLDLGYGGAFYSDLGYTGGLFVISDFRTKRNISTITGGLDIIKQLNPVNYFYDTDKYPNMGLNRSLEFGFVAQEVDAILPQITKEKKMDTQATAEKKKKKAAVDNSEIFLTLDYTRLIPILTKGIQEQNELIEDQKKKIDALENRIRKLEQLVNQLAKEN